MAQQRAQTDIRKTIKAKHMIGRDLKAFGLWIFMISGMINILALTGSVYMMQVYDRALTSGSVETLAFLSALAFGLFFFHGSFDALRSKIMVRLGARMDRRSTSDVIGKTEYRGLPLALRWTAIESATQVRVLLHVLLHVLLTFITCNSLLPDLS